jgi:hypothetical protein
MTISLPLLYVCNSIIQLLIKQVNVLSCLWIVYDEWSRGVSEGQLCWQDFDAFKQRLAIQQMQAQAIIYERLFTNTHE